MKGIDIDTKGISIGIKGIITEAKGISIAIKGVTIQRKKGISIEMRG